ncbi:uncharacterized protein BDZ83DRAFT_772939 [Colletotrichum acutatum]|uniref:Uncharacterized protein n=1 Tax=Glomerella acutata TaxID=27357 RepID=A0AAD8UR16_GLOAC|nr:uncharacterized protein BDZ83DRAFT_772939 [Colletotrichum acutatum]KAK1726785.1 hypothetical protein BDZ83DRAFT_772939 [Colletotrichum acutatum]
MKIFLIIILVFNTLVGVVTCFPDDSDKALLAIYESTGQCFHYVSAEQNRDKSVALCQQWCKKNSDSDSYGCDGTPYQGKHIDASLIQKDADGNQWVPAKCFCDLKVAEELLNIVVEGLAILDKIICAAMLEAFQSIIDVGINFIPGGAALNGARAAVQGAKTFAENGLEAASFFGDWVGPACGVRDWKFDLFGALVNAPDSMGVSTGCHKKDKTACFYETGVPNIKCRKQWSQACYHYSSMTEWTCGATQSTSNDGSATDVWGSTAIAALALTNQHWGWPWANGFVPRRVLRHANGLPKKDKYGNEMAVGCDRDEFPPRYFWPKANEAEEKGMVQRIRFLPYDENRKAGAMWRGFCNKNGAQSSTTRTSTVTSFIQSKFIRTVNANSRTAKGVDAVTSWVSIETARAIFKITDWDGLPKDTKWYGLRDNKCWPKDLTPDDPGWVLLTNDEFYSAGQHPDLAQHTQSYRGLPDLTLLRRVLQQRKNQPPYEFRELNSTEYDDKKIREGNGVGQIPRAYRDNVLPGMPQAKRRCRMIWAEENDDAQAWEDDQSIEILEGLDEDEFENQIEEDLYNGEEASMMMPRETEAILTLAGQGDTTTIPPFQASIATNGFPQSTQGYRS